MKVKTMLNSAKFAVKKHSPEILLGVGIVGTVGSTVLACKATLKVEDILDEREESLEKIEEVLSLISAGEKIEYSADDVKKDTLVINAQTAVKLAKAYGPSVTLMGVSIGCILASYRILNKRNVALMAAYKVLEEAFSSYRGRVVDELGEARDAHFMYGTETVTDETTVIDENGKKKKVKTEREELVPGAKLSGFAREFKRDEPDQQGGWDGSTQWCNNHEYNRTFLEVKETYFNAKLLAKGFVTMNEVYEELGFAPTEAGMICGWRHKSGAGDDYISFRPRGIDGNWITGIDGDNIILDFNVDGVIFDQKFAEKEMQ